MLLSLLQTDILWADPQANVHHVEQLIASLPHADLYILPEMWATGFIMQPEGVAEREADSVALRWMKRTAAERSCALCGSLAIQTADGLYRNRHYFVTPEGVCHYDKRHLFSYGHEDEAYVAGQERVIVEWCGVRFLLQTCYDLRFPVWSRYGWAGEYDAIIYVANWPRARRQAWEVLTRARAIENQCFVLAVNRVGQDAVGHYEGGSVAIDALGNTLAECKNTEASQMVTLSIQELQEVRRRYRFLSDSDHPMV